jgi:hypothetical protein
MPETLFFQYVSLLLRLLFRLLLLFENLRVNKSFKYEMRLNFFLGSRQKYWSSRGWGWISTREFTRADPEGQGQDRQDDLRHYLRLHSMLESLHLLWPTSGALELNLKATFISLYIFNVSSFSVICLSVKYWKEINNVWKWDELVSTQWLKIWTKKYYCHSQI